MSSVVSEPGHQNAGRLVLRPLLLDEPADVEHGPMTGASMGESDQAWELTDQWGSAEPSAAALAVTRRAGDMVELMGITVHDGAPPGTIRCLVQQLVAVLRRSDASVVSCSVDEAAVREELLAAGFVPLPDNFDGSSPRTPADRTRIILQL